MRKKSIYAKKYVPAMNGRDSHFQVAFKGNDIRLVKMDCCYQKLFFWFQGIEPFIY